MRASKQGIVEHDAKEVPAEKLAIPASVEGALTVGGTVLYRPPGNRRAYLCRIEQVEGSRILIALDMKAFFSRSSIPFHETEGLASCTFCKALSTRP
jgi:hypothetical protein